MGACLSAGTPAHIFDTVDGDERAYQERFLEDQVLGEGEFGQVRMVHDTKSSSKDQPLACKVLRKGVVFKDNVLYSPLKPHVLRGEVEMLRRLAGENYCLQLVAVYETPKLIYMITEYCGGGEMMEYVSNLEQDLRSEDVSRIAYQLLSAIDHCAKHQIIHRDIKPENVMFADPSSKAQLRLIDFGSGCIEEPESATGTLNGATATNGTTTNGTSSTNKDGLITHTTFAGSAFYISPEMFQKSYTQRTDVWSVGVALYVLVAGYPADELQKAFNILQTAKRKVPLRELPQMPPDMPDTYFELLEALLTYRHKKRPSAETCLQMEFVQFHKVLEEEQDNKGLSFEEVSKAAHAAASSENGSGRPNMSRRTASIRLTGSVSRHALFLGFKKYERSLTTLLATMLSKDELQRLLTILQDRVKAEAELSASATTTTTTDTATSNGSTAERTEQDDSSHHPSTTKLSNEQKLAVIPVKDLKTILESEIKNQTVLTTMEKLPNANVYQSFAYHVAFLADFVGDSASKMGSRSRRERSLSLGNSTRIMTSSNNSVRSAGSLRGMRNMSVRLSKRKEDPNSVHGSKVFVKPQPQRAQSVYM